MAAINSGEIRNCSYNIEDALGPSEHRYFGDGFKRTKYEVNVAYSPGHAKGEVAVLYHNNWSSKASDKVRKPHLSTLDASLISGQVGCALLRRHYPFSRLDSQQAWLRQIDVKAGNMAYEDLSAVPLTAQILSSGPTDDSLFGYLTSVEVRLGAMHVVLVIDHGLSQEGGSCMPDEDHYFTEGFRQRHCELSNISFHPGESEVGADLSLKLTSVSPGDGVMGAYPRSLLTIELLTSFAQLAQVLMYRLDNLNREQTNNLWMRNVSLHCPYPIIPRIKHQLALRCVRSTLLDRMNEQWRLTTVQARIGGHPEFTLSAKLCHSLPQGAY
jgi:hypothetical protein